MKSKLIPYEVIEKTVGGDTVSLLAVQQHYKPFIDYLSFGNTDLKEVLNATLLEAVLILWFQNFLITIRLLRTWFCFLLKDIHECIRLSPKQKGANPQGTVNRARDSLTNSVFIL